MSSPNISRRRRDTEDEDSDEPTYTSSSSNKRPRLNPADENESETGEDSEEGGSLSESEESASQIPPAAHPGLGPGGYKPGAIVRIKVKNFVTYTSAEFFPGPKLNMVIGPNGTGKSTLVCAICLGLGWGPQHLGRAKDQGEFVKHGSREATIEIELCGPPKMGRNPIIQRTIKRDGNKSTFMINGEPASNKQVLKLAQSFAIQVDNLCQFLPQDKVAEFAALSPVDLLRSTQRAAAGPEMIEWHDALKTLRGQQKKLEIDNRGDKDMLANMENRQEMQRADVERMRQRAGIKRKIEILEFLRPIVEYKEGHAALEVLKATKAQLQQEHEQLKADLEPALRALTVKESYIEQLNNVKSQRKDSVERASRLATTRGTQIDEYDGKIKDLAGQIEAERKTGVTHKKEAANAQQNIKMLQRKLEEEPVEFDPDFFNESLRAKRLEKRDLIAQAGEIKERRQPLINQGNETTRKINQAEQQIKNLNSQSGQQEHKLKMASQDSLRAYRWLLENQDRFEKEVFGPPIVTCSITNPSYANAVESLFQKTDFTSFTTQTRNDFRTLQRALNGELRLHDVSIRTCSMSLDSMRAPLPDDQIRQMGFDGWAKDFLTGPEPVIAMLCSEKSLHSTPIGLTDIPENVFNQLQNGTLSSWVSGQNTYQVNRRREYGPSATSTRVRQIKPAQVWTSQPVDVSLRRQYQENIDTWRDELKEVEDQLQSEKTIMEKLRQDIDRNEQEMRDIEREKTTKQTAYTQYRAIPEKIAQQEAKLQNITSLFERVRDTVRELRDKQDEFSILKAEATVNYADAVEAFRQEYEELIKLEVRLLEASSDLQTLRHRNDDCARMLEEKSIKAHQASVTVRETAMKLRAVNQKAKLVVREARNQPDAKEVMEGGVADYDMDQLNADIDSEKARLELTHGGSSHMIKEFEDREKQIEKLRSKLAAFQNKLTELGGAIDEIRKNWEPRLDALIKKISDAFADSFNRIGCAGQVTLDKVEDEPETENEVGGSDFDQWAIQIHVKFRENAQLSLLDSHRQSGGERAVSTIFYLMALQSLSASPFRVVDEINQGMDPRNERMVHGRLVDIACASSEDAHVETDEDGSPIGGSGGGQYFLITPKLLNGLSYKRGMRVLCIYSGEHMPDDYGKIDFKLAIRNMKAINAKTGNTGTARRIPGNSQVDIYA
ncbi:hypothetical protein PENANT_c015G10997 [Penicillium antarcticum]|uniref:Structural maintenance of chromosomes protein 5 n=1 Tax=Penicillium antarcticum TaxID=416450 RepID=A0A1V6Q514_9EURO|nr:uncharacterized protein N7508_004807 [Penicillium antarcticum]KAJ5305792.1 hypothetical protein N7508_004807 [Penicillium antarcticum]OQD83876.1 hypothetical protein PENANT_c015G10997 [Penicillium antarcticum]